jgi:cell division protein ZapA (FtsZ GTPase activity inhibitor)
MLLDDRVAELEKRVQELGAQHIVALAEIEALMFCLVAALRSAPVDSTMEQLEHQMEQLSAMTLASGTSDEIEEVRSRKAQQIFSFVAAAIRQRRQRIGEFAP